MKAENKRALPIFLASILMLGSSILPVQADIDLDAPFFDSKSPLDETKTDEGSSAPEARVEESLKKVEKTEKKIERTEKRMESKVATAEADLEMYQQMGQVNNWLAQWVTWNHHWPEPIDETNDAVRQLCELVPNNPYQWSRPQEAKGDSTDPDYFYYNQPMNQVPDASTGFQGDSLDPGTSWGALGPKRVNLVYDPSLSAQNVEDWETEPPSNWRARPGTIYGISNSQNLIVVWGAGADGRPLKVPGSRKTRMFVSNILMSPTGVQND